MSTFVYVTHVSEGASGTVYSKIKRVNLDRVDAIEDIENATTGAKARLIWLGRSPRYEMDVLESAVEIMARAEP